MKSITLLLFFCLAVISCSETQYADVILTNGKIYTVDPSNEWASAMAIFENQLIAIGSEEEVFATQGPQTLITDLNGNFVMPGIIEGHGHFGGIGKMLMGLNLMNVKSWQEVDSIISSKKMNPGEWIVGRGWHQDKWNALPDMNVEGYPNAESMRAATEDNPVILIHASGHALFANHTAMKLAGVSLETPDPEGGRILRDDQGNPTGVFEENAMDPIYKSYAEWLDNLSEEESKEIALKEIKLAEEECLSKGITSFQDAGSSFDQIRLYRTLSENDQLNIRLWVMLRHSYEEMNGNMSGLPYINPENQFFTCRAIKSEIDGALGSYGAWLLEPYTDKPGFVGQNTTDVEEVGRIADLAKVHGMQLCVHAIGDKGNQVILDLMEEKLGSDNQDARWRMEHAQHLDPKDIPRFAELGVIASMQAVHCTSDAPFVERRLGPHRSRVGAYVWKSLLKAGAVVSNGTDAPVEDVDPLPNLYASVTRTRTDNGMVFFKEESITRAQAIHSMTMACAYAGFEEEIKGSLEIGKLADFIILDKNLMTCTDQEILDAQVLATYVGGRKVYGL